MAERRRVKQKRQKDQPELLSKEEKAVAKYLRFNIPAKDGKLVGMPVKYFLANDAVNALLDSKWAKKDSLFTTRASCLDYCQRLLNQGMFHRATRQERKRDRDKKKKKKEDVEESIKEEDRKSTKEKLSKKKAKDENKEAKFCEKEGVEKAKSGSEKVKGVSEKAKDGSEKAKGGSEKAKGGSEKAKGGSEKAKGGSEKAKGGSEKAKGGSEKAKGGSQEEKRSVQEISDDKTPKSEDKEDKKEDDKKKKKKEKKIKLVMADNQVFKDGDEIYVWIYDPVPLKTFIIGLFLVLGAIGVCLFPLWPPEVRLGVYYLSLSVAVCIGCLLVLCVVRVILFCMIWCLTFGRHHFWFLPNLNEDVGFYESFQPLYHHEYMSNDTTSTVTDVGTQEGDDPPTPDDADSDIQDGAADSNTGSDSERADNDDEGGDNDGLDNDGLDNDGLDNDGLDNDGLENDENGYEIVDVDDIEDEQSRDDS